ADSFPTVNYRESMESGHASIQVNQVLTGFLSYCTLAAASSCKFWRSEWPVQPQMVCRQRFGSWLKSWQEWPRPSHCVSWPACSWLPGLVQSTRAKPPSVWVQYLRGPVKVQRQHVSLAALDRDYPSA